MRYCILYFPIYRDESDSGYRMFEWASHFDSDDDEVIQYEVIAYDLSEDTATRLLNDFHNNYFKNTIK